MVSDVSKLHLELGPARPARYASQVFTADAVVLWTRVRVDRDCVPTRGAAVHAVTADKEMDEGQEVVDDDVVQDALAALARCARRERCGEQGRVCPDSEPG